MGTPANLTTSTITRDFPIFLVKISQVTPPFPMEKQQKK